MLSYVRGMVFDILDDKLIIDTGAYGIEINTSSTTINNLQNKKEEVLIYTYLKVSEDNLSLYGFLTKEEIEAFKLLISVNGVGPKAAVSILSNLNVFEIYNAILLDDDKSISKANGIGTKIAKRIINELKDKINLKDLDIFSKDDVKDSESSKVFIETVEALISLGYSKAEALRVLRKIDVKEDTTPAKALSLALREISR